MDRKARLVGVLAMVVGLAFTTPAGATTVLIREFRYRPELVSLSQKDGLTEVRLARGIPEYRPGRPDLPMLDERVEIPVGTRVTRVDVLVVESAPLGEAVTVAPAVEIRRDAGPERRTPPDPAWYARGGVQPADPVVLGYQGFERGRHFALLQISPVRWDAASRRLERVTRLVVRISLEPSGIQPLTRERIVPDWEDDRAAG